MSLSQLVLVPLVMMSILPRNRGGIEDEHVRVEKVTCVSCDLFISGSAAWIQVEDKAGVGLLRAHWLWQTSLAVKRIETAEL